MNWIKAWLALHMFSSSFKSVSSSEGSTNAAVFSGPRLRLTWSEQKRKTVLWSDQHLNSFWKPQEPSSLLSVEKSASLMVRRCIGVGDVDKYWGLFWTKIMKTSAVNLHSSTSHPTIRNLTITGSHPSFLDHHYPVKGLRRPGEYLSCHWMRGGVPPTHFIIFLIKYLTSLQILACACDGITSSQSRGRLSSLNRIVVWCLLSHVLALISRLTGSSNLNVSLKSRRD